MTSILNPLFTYGDRIRRKAGGPVRTVRDITDGEYHFTDGGFCLIADQDCYEVVEKTSGFYRVASTIGSDLLDTHLQHGYEERFRFAAALHRLLDYWGGRTGEAIGERNKFLLLRFHDTPGGKPDEAWLPLFLLTSCPTPPYIRREKTPEELLIEELDEAFGFD